MSFTPPYQCLTFHWLFSEKTHNCWTLTQKFTHSKRATRWPENPFWVLSQGAGFSQELSATSNLNLFPPFCKPKVYTGLAPASCFSWAWLVVTFTHTREVCRSDSRVWSLEVIGKVLRAFLLSPLCTCPPVSVVQAWAWGPGEGILTDLHSVLWFWGWMCCVSGLI